MFEIGIDGPGRLWIMPRPQSLLSDVATWQAAGITDVLSMLEKDEAAQLGLADEPAACKAVGIAFHTHPIPDFGLPDAVTFDDLIRSLSTVLNHRAGIGVHCRGGIGRSGMVCTGLLVAQGLSARAAIAHVTAARGVAVPDTADQAAFIENFAQRV